MGLRKIARVVLVSAVVMLAANPSWADEVVNQRIQALEEELLDLKESMEVQKEAVRSIETNTVGIKNTSLGGYGELNWANFDGEKKDEFDYIVLLGA